MDIFTEKIPVGQKLISQGRTISEGDFTLLHNLTWNIDPFQSNKEYMKNTQFGERILGGPCVLAIATGLAISTSRWKDIIFQEPIHPVGLLAFESVQFKKPVMIGDTLTTYSEIVEIQPTSKPNRVVLKVKLELFNQRHELIMEGYSKELVAVKE